MVVVSRKFKHKDKHKARYAGSTEDQVIIKREGQILVEDINKVRLGNTAHHKLFFKLATSFMKSINIYWLD